MVNNYDKIMNRPKIIVFEGGDICGKTTQAKLTVEKNQCKYFKFPNYDFVIKKEELPKKYLDKYIPCKNFYKIDENGDYKIDMTKIFDSINKYIYNSTYDKIVHDYKNIYDILISNITISSLDKFSWVKNEYYKMCNLGYKEKVVIDRFLLSGQIYNCDVPLAYMELHDNLNGNFLTNLDFNTIYDLSIFNFNVVLQMMIKAETEDITKINYYEFLDTFVNRKDYDTCVCSGLLTIVDLCKQFGYLKNIRTIYFDKSEILYNKFKQTQDNTRKNDDYDKNVVMRYIVSKEFEEFINKIKKSDCLDRDSISKVYTDLLLSVLKTPEDFNNKLPFNDFNFKYF